MITCPKCQREAVEKDAGLVASIPYYYCKVCKIEVDPTLDNPGEVASYSGANVWEYAKYRYKKSKHLPKLKTPTPPALELPIGKANKTVHRTTIDYVKAYIVNSAIRNGLDSWRPKNQADLGTFKKTIMEDLRGKFPHVQDKILNIARREIFEELQWNKITS